MKDTIVILGASPDQERYSYKAQKLLEKNNYQISLVSPRYDQVDGVKVYKNLEDCPKSIQAITMYVNPEISSKLQEQIIKANPDVVIFNPGTENDDLEAELEKNNIRPVRACTLVLINTNQFEAVLRGE